LLFWLRRQWNTDEWERLQARLDTAFESIIKRGFCVSLGDRRPDVYAVGAPVLTDGGTVMAINCGGMPSEVTADVMEKEIGPRLALAASQLSTLGSDA
jgi:DNA-binding IclR family transcriptional regulator